jgi:hypothetical protein
MPRVWAGHPARGAAAAKTTRPGHRRLTDAIATCFSLVRGMTLRRGRPRRSARTPAASVRSLDADARVLGRRARLSSWTTSRSAGRDFRFATDAGARQLQRWRRCPRLCRSGSHAGRRRHEDHASLAKRDRRARWKTTPESTSSGTARAERQRRGRAAYEATPCAPTSLCATSGTWCTSTSRRVSVGA